MLDPYIRPLIDPLLEAIGKRLAALGISANQMTLIGFAFGIFAMIMIVFHQYGTAALLIGCNRLADGLDGAIARNDRLSDFGGFLDIVCDFIIYSGIVFAFGCANPHNLFYAALLILSFIGPITTFLAYAIMASKRKKVSERRGKKSFYYLGGICEGTETAVVLILFCLMPQNFNSIAITFSILCWMTTIGRIYSAWIDFAEPARAINDSSLSAGTTPVVTIKFPTQ
jgi:phosphatidylglycerophosphate synthase